MEPTQLLASMSAQVALLDAVNAMQMVLPVLPVKSTTICHQPHVFHVVKANMHLLDQLTQLHASLVWMKTVSLVVQVTPLESVPYVKNKSSPLQAFARIAQIPTVSLVLHLGLEDVPLVLPVIT